ncbi:MAG: OsmC family protein [Gammaproteobacteria bacterium]|nr:OsmC family protein [Gammaproteobacteria bacterium]
MKATVKWLDHMSFVGESGSGHSVVMDGAPDVGGRNMGVRPMEMVLLGLGGCTSFDLVLILQRQRQAVADVQVEIEAERATKVPKIFTKIHVHYVVEGRGLDPKKVERAVKMTAEKYCSVSIMLSASVEMSHDFEIIEQL